MATPSVFLAGGTGAALVRGIFKPGSQGVLEPWAFDAGLRVGDRGGLASMLPHPGPMSLADATSSLRAIRDVLRRAPFPPGLMGPRPDILFGSASKRPRKGDVAPMTWTTEVPPGAFVPLSPELYLCAPAFLFVQRADELGLPGTISYGNELCGLFSRDESERMMNDHPAFVTPDELGRFLSHCSRGRGTKTAREALTWVRPRFRSPRESDTYLLACLPRERGGYGIRPLPEVNVSIDVPTCLRYLTDVRSYEVDLLWRDAMAVVEYDGADHDNPEQRLRDDIKTQVLQRMGYLVIRISWRVLGDPREFDRRMRLLGERLRLAVPATDRGFECRRSELRRALFESSLR